MEKHLDLEKPEDEIDTVEFLRYLNVVVSFLSNLTLGVTCMVLAFQLYFSKITKHAIGVALISTSISIFSAIIFSATKKTDVVPVTNGREHFEESTKTYIRQLTNRYREKSVENPDKCNKEFKKKLEENLKKKRREG